MPKAGDKRVVQGACTFSWGLRVANDSRVVVCIRLLGRCLVSDCGAVSRVQLQGPCLVPPLR